MRSADKERDKGHVQEQSQQSQQRTTAKGGLIVITVKCPLCVCVCVLERATYLYCSPPGSCMWGPDSTIGACRRTETTLNLPHSAPTPEESPVARAGRGPCQSISEPQVAPDPTTNRRAGLEEAIHDPSPTHNTPMAYLTHGAGFSPQQAADPGYTHAVFRALDDASSRNPFSNPSHSHVRPLTCHGPPIHPTTLELAEGLIRMRSSVEPMTAAFAPWPHKHLDSQLPTNSSSSHDNAAPGDAAPGLQILQELATAAVHSDQTKHQKLYDPAAPIVPLHGTHCCCRGVADVYLNILDEKDPADAAMLTRLYAACRDDLCPLHLDAYAKLITKAIERLSIARPLKPTPDSDASDEATWEFDFTVGQTGTGTKWTPGPRRRRRATSLPGIDEYEFDLPPKRRRVRHTKSVRSRAVYANGTTSETPQAGPPPSAPYPAQSPCRPTLDACFDEEFRRKVLAELAQNFTDLKEDDWSRGETTNRYIHAILSKSKPPNTDVRKGPVDAGFLSGEEAAAVIEQGGERIPLFTQGQQQFQWTDNKRRPIVQLFHRMEDLTREVSVQIPSHNFDLPSYKTKSLEDIRDRFVAGCASQDPWNVLDLRSPLPPAILPKFLTGENCQLLPRIRDALLEGHSAERTKATREEWNEWTELLEWVLISEGGHNTAPHMDSHGWSTWITIQEGHFGFGWLARPTEKEQDAWMNDPLGYTGGKWRFVILKPGQTVFFPSGTVHFVFRLHQEQTLALGGHLLQWTALERWVQVILYQLKNPNITNEDLGTAPLKYVRTARKLVDNRMASSRLGSMGGMPAVAKFMVLSNVRPLSLSRVLNLKKRGG